VGLQLLARGQQPAARVGVPHGPLQPGPRVELAQLAHGHLVALVRQLPQLLHGRAQGDHPLLHEGVDVGRGRDPAVGGQHGDPFAAARQVDQAHGEQRVGPGRHVERTAAHGLDVEAPERIRPHQAGGEQHVVQHPALGIALVGGQAEPARGLLVVPFHPAAALVSHAQAGLGRSIAGLGGRADLGQAGRVAGQIAAIALAEGLQHAYVPPWRFFTRPRRATIAR